MKKVGYIQGTFDLFHIGHLNLIKNAKKYCDYLIVAVNSDELVHDYKKHYPTIPFNERLEIVNNIKMVDKVVKADDRDKIKAYNKYKFDYLIMGDDWKGTNFYNIVEKEINDETNAKIIYLPYTNTTSTTIIKQNIIKEYLKNEKKNNLDR